MSASYLRGFPAQASSFLTVLLNLISANPDVLVRKKKKKNKVLLTIRYQRRVLHCKSEVSCSVFVCADVDLDNLCAEKEITYESTNWLCNWLQLETSVSNN